MEARELAIDDRSWVERLVSSHFGSSRIVSRGVLHDSGSLPGLIAENDGMRVGLLQYRVAGDRCEVVVLIAVPSRR